MNKILSIAQNTFRESIRSKVLYSTLIFAVLLVGASAILGSVTIGEQVRVIKSFGLFAISLFSVGFAVISGATLLHKELARKTIYNILGKAVERYEFLVGKYLGLLATAAVLVLTMSLGLFFFCRLFEASFDWLLFQACWFMLLELVIVCAVGIFFSSIVVTPLLSGLFTFGVFLAGRSAEWLSATPFKILYWGLPNFSWLAVADQIVYGISASAQTLGWASLYALGYSSILLWLGSLFFSRRDFN